MLNDLTSRDWTIVGEWSNAVSHPPSGSDYKKFMSAFVRSQWNAYGSSGTNSGKNATKGAFFWNFKIEHGDAAWSYLDGINDGVMPNNFNFEFCQ